MMRKISYLCLLFLLCSCQSSRLTLVEGIWRGEFALAKATLPINMEIKRGKKNTYQIHFKNANEDIVAEELSEFGDSLIIKMPVFDSEFHLKVENKGQKLTGYWWNKSKKSNNKLPFSAVAGLAHRFEEEIATTSQPLVNFSGRWAATFDLENEKPYPAVGEFHQNGKQLTGTFLTETGDYRYLQGVVNGNELKLSCFDGSHAFLFTGVYDAEKKKIQQGNFYSGLTYQEKWEATQDENALLTLALADTLTYLKKGYDKLAFSFPDLDRQQVSLSDKRYQGKVVIVQILGSWCPNCMDETRFLSDLYRQYKENGLEIIGLAYERSTDFEKAAENVRRVKTHFQADYAFLVAGVSDKTEAAKTLPMLSSIIGYPTTIFIDKKGKVRHIHTGFAGPGTGAHYETLKKEVIQRVKELLAE